VVNPSVPKAWSQAIMKALEKRPEHRFQTAEEFARALEEALPGAAGSLEARVYAPAPVPPPPGAPGSVTPASPPSAQPAPPSAAVAPSSESKPQAPAPAPSCSSGAPDRVDRLATPIVKTPAPAHPRHEVRFAAEVLGADGKSFGTLPCQDISRGGLFLCSESLRPALFTRLTVKLPGHIDVLAEVVRHVTPDQARAWNMRPGFGVQFLNLSAAQKEVIDQLVKGLPMSAATPAPKNVTDDVIARRVLDQWHKRINGDHYVVLALPEDADFSDIRARGRELKRELEGLKRRPLSEAQAAMVESALERVQTALDVLGHPSARMEFDANRGNYRGVARCIAAGLTVTEMERLRERYLKAHPGAESSARIKFLSGKAFEKANDVPQALSSYDQALKQDPMNLEIQQHYWALRRKMGQ
jgi:serine/threonine-protein kinase